MKTIILRPKNKRESKVFIEMAKALNTPFEIKDKGSYDPAFAEKVLKAPNKETIKAMDELERGKGIRSDSVRSLFGSI